MTINRRPARRTDQFVGRTLLLAEDNMINIVHVESVLKHWNLNIEVVKNGMDAVQRVKDKEYDILLLDIQMPGMNGFEAARKIRQLGHKLVIIAFTVQHVSLEELSVNGINDIIQKPFSIVEIEEKIFKYLGG